MNRRIADPGPGKDATLTPAAAFRKLRWPI